MALTQEQLAHAIRCMQGVELQAFSASPTTISPFGSPARLTWSASSPANCLGLQFLLNGQQVDRSGTQDVRPAATTTYRLEATMLGFRRTLASATVVVNTQGCIIGAVLEDKVREDVRDATAEFDQDTPEVRERSTPGVEVTARGVALRLRFTIIVNNFANPDLDVDCEVSIRAQDGGVRARYRSFAVDVDWPWWVTGVSLGVTKIVEEVIESRIEGVLRPKLLDAVVAAFDADLAMIPPTHRLYTLTTAADRIDWMVCPISV